MAAFGKPKCAGVQDLYRSPKLTILHIAWPPSFTQTPHNHLLWAEIGVYSGREDNIFWRRRAPDAKWSIEVEGAESLCAGSSLSLERDVIHSVTNPLDKVTASLHVYGGDLAPAAPRSMWDGETLVEAPLDYQRDDRAVETYNARLTDWRTRGPQQLDDDVLVAAMSVQSRSTSGLIAVDARWVPPHW